MTPSTRAAADAPIRWPPAVVSANRAPQRSRRHAWPSADGLAVALGPLWALLQRHPCSRRHATPRARMELPRPPRSPDRHVKTIGVCVSSSAFDRHPVGRLNRSTGQKLACEPRLRMRTRDLERSNITLVATLIRRLVDLRHHENIPVPRAPDNLSGARAEPLTSCQGLTPY